MDPATAPRQPRLPPARPNTALVDGGLATAVGELAPLDTTRMLRESVAASLVRLPQAAGGDAPGQIAELLAVCDLTSLEPTDTPERIETLAAQAVAPDPADASVGPVAALCVHTDLVAAARTTIDRLGAGGVGWGGGGVRGVPARASQPAGEAGRRRRCGSCRCR
jgi:hypothetical protein